MPLGGFPDAEEIAVGWAASCFQGNKGMERCLEREWAAGGRWEAVLTRAAELRVQRRLRPCEGKKKKRKGGAAGAAGASGVAARTPSTREQSSRVMTTLRPRGDLRRRRDASALTPST